MHLAPDDHPARSWQAISTLRIERTMSSDIFAAFNLGCVQCMMFEYVKEPSKFTIVPRYLTAAHFKLLRTSSSTV